MTNAVLKIPATRFFAAHFTSQRELVVRTTMMITQSVARRRLQDVYDTTRSGIVQTAFSFPFFELQSGKAIPVIAREAKISCELYAKKFLLGIVEQGLSAAEWKSSLWTRVEGEFNLIKLRIKNLFRGFGSSLRAVIASEAFLGTKD
jgi:hypothetical protein